MEKIVITQFSDPMMGLAWECEPALWRVFERYGDAPWSFAMPWPSSSAT